MTTARKPGWYVTCSAYQAGPFDAARVRSEQQAIEQLGACHEQHRLEYEPDPTLPRPRVKFVRQYTNSSGRVFRRYVVSDRPTLVEDVLVRGPHQRDRWGRRVVSWPLLTNAEAKDEAARRLTAQL